MISRIVKKYMGKKGMKPGKIPEDLSDADRAQLEDNLRILGNQLWDTIEAIYRHGVDPIDLVKELNRVRMSHLCATELEVDTTLDHYRRLGFQGLFVIKSGDFYAIRSEIARDILPSVSRKSMEFDKVIKTEDD